MIHGHRKIVAEAWCSLQASIVASRMHNSNILLPPSTAILGFGKCQNNSIIYRITGTAFRSLDPLD
jgi:hypothetical protein